MLKQLDLVELSTPIFDKRNVMSEPTNEQLANFVCIMAFGPGYSPMQVEVAEEILRAWPFARESWLRRHAQFQRKADELAEEIRAQEDDHV
jgi:hypothetical protein